MNSNDHLCIFGQSPTPGHECLEAISTQGRACRKCNTNCYRKGWNHDHASADNKELVRKTRNGER